MQILSVQRVGAVAAWLVAGCTVSFSLFVLLTPASALTTAGTVWTLLAADVALLLAGLFGLAVVPAVTERMASLAPGWMRWTATLAQLGFAVLAVVSAWQIEYETVQANALLTDHGLGGTLLPQVEDQHVLSEAMWIELFSRAPHGWLDALIGFWIVSVAWIGRGRHLFPEDLNSVGRVAGTLAFCAPLGTALGVEPLVTMGVMSGLIVQPLWFAWTGVVLLREEAARLPRLRVAVRLARRKRQFAAFLHLDRGSTRRSATTEHPAEPVCN